MSSAAVVIGALRVNKVKTISRAVLKGKEASPTTLWEPKLKCSGPGNYFILWVEIALLQLSVSYCHLELETKQTKNDDAQLAITLKHNKTLSITTLNKIADDRLGERKCIFSHHS